MKAFQYIHIYILKRIVQILENVRIAFYVLMRRMFINNELFYYNNIVRSDIYMMYVFLPQFSALYLYAKVFVKAELEIKISR